jgi:hypothetical protein
LTLSFGLKLFRAALCAFPLKGLAPDSLGIEELFFYCVEIYVDLNLSKCIRCWRFDFEREELMGSLLPLDYTVTIEE